MVMCMLVLNQTYVAFVFTGHSSDGDVRRRSLMLSYVVPISEPNFSVNFPLGRLGDQDYIHNIKKMVNPLDHVSKDLRIGETLAY